MCTHTDVPSPAPLLMVSAPPTVPSRSDRQASPSPRGRPGSKPHPSSRITRPSLPSSWLSDTSTSLAPACLTTFDSASASTYQAVASICSLNRTPRRRGSARTAIGDAAGWTAPRWPRAARGRTAPADGSRTRSPGRRAAWWPGRVACRPARRPRPGRPAAAAGAPARPWPTAPRSPAGPVVQDRLDPPALGVLARHHAVTGRRQFGRLVPDLLDALGKFRGEVEVVHADRGLGGKVRQQPAVLGQQRAVGTRAALDTSQDAAVILDGHGRGRLAGRRAVRHHPQRPVRRIQRHPGPGQVQAAADLAGQVAQQPGGAGTRVRLSPKRLRFA